MFANAAHQRRRNLAFFAGWFVVCAVAAFARTADASVILSWNPVTSIETQASVDMSSLLGADSVFGSDMSFASNEQPVSRALPNDVPATFPPIEEKSPSILLGTTANDSGRSGAGTSSTTGDGGGSHASAITFFSHDLPSPAILLAWLRDGELLNIPPASPFELLRPPQEFTNVA